MRGWQANKKRTLCVACNFRALPETEIPPLCGGDIYCVLSGFSALLVVTFVKAFSPECSLVLVIAFQDGLEDACAAQKGKPNEKGARKEWNKKASPAESRWNCITGSARKSKQREALWANSSR